MPEGSHIADDRKVVLPPRGELATSMEALIHHFKLVTEGFRVPEGEAYSAVESPRGELGCYVVADGSPKPRRVHMRDPSFVNLQALRPMAQGRLPGRPDHDDRLAGQRDGRRRPMTADGDPRPHRADPARVRRGALADPARAEVRPDREGPPDDGGPRGRGRGDRLLGRLRRERRLVLRPPLPEADRRARRVGVHHALVHAARLGRAARAHLRPRGPAPPRRHQRGRRRSRSRRPSAWATATAPPASRWTPRRPGAR